MTDGIIRLGSEDFDRLNEVVEAAFDKDRGYFRKALPRLFRPEEPFMRNHHAIERDGRLAASLGIYPFDVRFGDVTLHVAGIGGVATHPQYQGQGLMKKLMSYAGRFIHEQGFDLCYLGGQRQRYRYFGWERTGIRYRVHLSHANVRHDLSDVSPAGLVPIDSSTSQAHLEQINSLHAMDAISSVRPIDHLYHWLHNWDSRPLMSLDEQGNVEGYIVYTDRITAVAELAARDEPTALRLLLGQMQLLEAEGLDINFPAVRTPLLKRLEPIIERITIQQSGNWQIYNWASTVGALMSLRAKYEQLIDGEVVLSIVDRDQRIKLSVKGNRPQCESTEDSPDLSLDGPTAARLLCGPYRASQVLDLPVRAAVLDQWCPLPLATSTMDTV